MDTVSSTFGMVEEKDRRLGPFSLVLQSQP